MAAITYRTVIVRAISHFNDIQIELYNKGAKRADGVTAITAISDSLVPTDEYDKIIREQLQLIPTTTYTVAGPGVFDVKDHASVKVDSAVLSALHVTDYPDNVVSVSDESAGYYTISGLVKGKLTVGTAGWIAAGDTTELTDSSAVLGKVQKAAGSMSVSGNTLSVTANPTVSLNTDDSSTISAINISGSSAIGSLQSSEQKVEDLDSGAWDYFIKVNSDVAGSGSGDVTATYNVATPGILKLNSGNALSGSGSVSANVSGSSSTFIPVKGANVSSASTVESNYFTETNTGYTVEVTPGYKVDNDGWVRSTNGVVNGTKVTKYIKAGEYSASVANISAGISSSLLTTTKPSGTLNTDYWELKGTASASASANITSAGWIEGGSKTSSPETTKESGSYYLPKAKFKYVKDSESAATFIQCLSAGYMPTGALTMVEDSDGDSISDIDYAVVKGTLTSPILLSGSTPTGAYKITLGKSSTTNPGYISGTAGQGTLELDKEYYIDSAVVKVPTINQTNSSVSINAGKITLTKTITVAPSVEKAGYIDVGSDANVSVTLSGDIDETSLTPGQGVCEIKNNTTSATKSGDKAVISDSTSSPYNTYVLVEASGSGSVSVGTGYIQGTSASSGTGNDTARIAAAVNPSFSMTTAPSATFSTSGETTYNSTTGAIATKSSKSATGTIASVSYTTESYKDKYIVGSVTASTQSGTATASIHEDATGETVDEYVEALYKRILGQTYTAVEAD